MHKMISIWSCVVCDFDSQILTIHTICDGQIKYTFNDLENLIRDSFWNKILG